MLPDAVVYALVVAAEYDDVLLQGELVGDGLVEPLPVRRHIYDLVVVALSLQLFEHTEDRLYGQHHTRVRAEAIVVHILALSKPVFAQIVYINFHQAFLSGPAYNGVREGTVEQLWNNRKYVNSHNSTKVTILFVYL